MHLFLLNLNCGRYLKNLMTTGRQIMKILKKYTIYRAIPRSFILNQFCSSSLPLGYK